MYLYCWVINGERDQVSASLLDSLRALGIGLLYMTIKVAGGFRISDRL
jgi:hypothetical protein